MSDVTTANMADPIAIACTKCGAAAGATCREPNGRSMGRKYHAPRAQAAAGGETPAGDRATEAQKAPEILASQKMQDSSICVIIKTSRFTVSRTVRRDKVTVVAGALPDEEDEPGDEAGAVNQDSVKVAKELLDSPQLRAIVTYDHYTKLWFKQRSVPSPLLRSSAYMFKLDALEEMYGYLESRAADRKPLVEAFVVAMPDLIAQAEKDLGPLFDRSQYPRDAEAARRLFSFEYQVVEIGTPDAKLRRISQALFEKEREKAQAVWTSAVGQVEDALIVGMQKVVTHLAESMGDGKRVHPAQLKKVTEFLDAFPRRNLSGREDLAELVQDAQKLVSGVDAKMLRAAKKNGKGGDEAVRSRVAEGFEKIRKSLDGMLEASPQRARVVTGDDEV